MMLCPFGLRTSLVSITPISSCLRGHDLNTSYFHTYSALQQKKKQKSLRETIKSKYRNVTYDPKDLNKRPSDLEIKTKDLPPNTPTLGERINRDVRHYFHQGDEKSGYHNLRQYPSDFQEVIESAKEGLRSNPKKAIKESFQVVAQEIRAYAKEVTEINPIACMDKFPNEGDRRREWGFDSEDDLHQWILTKDSDWGEGYSAANLEFSHLGHAAVRGELSTRVPADGRTQNAGYVNLASVKKRKSFAREVLMHDWMEYTHLTMNIRGDGRKWFLNLHVKRGYDILWNDRWSYPIFTRGGPYWQYVKIPWSKFILGSKGHIQDRQFRVPLECGVVGVSLTLMDSVSGPFQLEIKDISLHNDPTSDDEMFAYEMYKIPHFWAGY